MRHAKAIFGDFWGRWEAEVVWLQELTVEKVCPYTRALQGGTYIALFAMCALDRAHTANPSRRAGYTPPGSGVTDASHEGLTGSSHE